MCVRVCVCLCVGAPSAHHFPRLSLHSGRRRPLQEEPGRIHVDAQRALVINTTHEEDGGMSFVAKYTCQVGVRACVCVWGCRVRVRVGVPGACACVGGRCVCVCGWQVRVDLCGAEHTDLVA